MTIHEIVSAIKKENERNENSEEFLTLLKNRLLYIDQKVIDEAHELVEIGLVLFQDDLNLDAREHFEKSIELFPTCNAYFLLAMVEFDEDNYYQALRWSIAAAMFVNKREFNFWNAFMLRNICVIFLLARNEENWLEHQSELKFIFNEYLLPNFEIYERERKKYGIRDLFLQNINMENITIHSLKSALPPKGWVYTFTQDNKSELH
jgi:tetratricopeptide (TPR) repeat protein